MVGMFIKKDIYMKYGTLWLIDNITDTMSFIQQQLCYLKEYPQNNLKWYLERNIQWYTKKISWWAGVSPCKFIWIPLSTILGSNDAWRDGWIVWIKYVDTVINTTRNGFSEAVQESCHWWCASTYTIQRPKLKPLVLFKGKKNSLCKWVWRMSLMDFQGPETVNVQEWSHDFEFNAICFFTISIHADKFNEHT